MLPRWPISRETHFRIRSLATWIFCLCGSNFSHFSDESNTQGTAARQTGVVRQLAVTALAAGSILISQRELSSRTVETKAFSQLKIPCAVMSRQETVNILRPTTGGNPSRLTA
jgi:hypothetical protein